MGLLGTTLIGATLFSKLFAGDTATAQSKCAEAVNCRETVRYTVQRLPSPPPTPTPEATRSAAEPTPLPLLGSEPLASPSAEPTPETLVEASSVEAVERRTSTGSLTETLVITGSGVSSITVSTAILTPTEVISTADVAPELITETTVADAKAIDSAYVEPYTSTNQAAPPPTAEPESPPEVEPPPVSACATTSSAHFELIPIEGAATRDHPDAVHGDLNLALRGFIPISESLEQVTYNGNTDGNAPRLHGLFEPNRQAQISSVFKVNDWNWKPLQCGGHPRGCPAPPSDEVYWPVTMIGLAATPGEPIFIPERGPEIHPGGYIAMVLYAEEKRITLGYTRRDTVSAGYTVHLENVCVDPNLLALYKAQMDGAGWHATGRLPALRNNQAVGTALDSEIGVAIRDVGTFMDPRSHKDWWK